MLLSNQLEARLSEVAIHFGTDGWRGVIGEDFTYENVRKVAHAIARYVVRAEKPGAGIVVGYDTRFASERFARVAAETVAAPEFPFGSRRMRAPRPPFRCSCVSDKPRREFKSPPATIRIVEWSEVQGRVTVARRPRPSSRRSKQNSRKFCAMACPLLPPRGDLIHSLDVRTPYLETLSRPGGLGSLARFSSFRSSSTPCTAPGAACCWNSFAATASTPLKFAASAIPFSAE